MLQISLLSLLGIFSLIPLLLLSFAGMGIQDTSAIAYFPPPLKQIQEGVKPTEVTCTEGMELVLKQSNGQPACIKPSSVAKLIERGWAIHVLPDYSFGNNNSEIFSIGQYETTVETIEYLNGTKGFLAKPISEGEFPGIIMIHEWWGLNENIHDMAEKLASHGYLVLAVDLYEGQVGTNADEARQLIGSFEQSKGIENMNSAVGYLQENYSPTSMGSIGWCFGGQQSLNLALNNDDMDATVIYYGRLVTEPEQLSLIDWPVLGIFAELDNGIPLETVEKFEESLNKVGVENEIHIYPGVDHAFANPSGERYAPEESQDAWDKTIKFLKENLR